jgi:hypothetical protein
VPSSLAAGDPRMEHEIKYLLPPQRTAPAKVALGAICRPDPSYPANHVMSLYFDNLRLGDAIVYTNAVWACDPQPRLSGPRQSSSRPPGPPAAVDCRAAAAGRWRRG